MYEWLIDLLNINIDEIFVGNKENNEILGGYILSGSSRIYIKRGIPIFFTKQYYRKYRRLIAAYRLIPHDFWHEEKSDWFKHLRRFHKELICRGLALSKKFRLNILSIGCGSGWEIWTITHYAYKEGFSFKIVGCDLALKPLHVARKRARDLGYTQIDFVCCVAENLPFRNDIFDIVTAIFGPLDHSINYVKAFKEASRILKSGGIFIATMLNRFALDWIFKVLKSPKLFMKTIKYADRPHARIRIPLNTHHISIPTHFYNVIEVKQLAKISNMKIVEIASIFSILPLNFKRTKFRSYHFFLSKIDRSLSRIPPFNSLGRYIGVIAKKE